MAERERLTVAWGAGRFPAVHLLVGLAITALLVIFQPPEGDALEVKHIADSLADGGVAYRDFLVEYPPLSLLHIFLPRFLGGPSDFAYEVLFSVLGLSLALACGAVVYWLAQRGWSAEEPVATALVFCGLALAILPLVMWRFDIMPTLLSVLALAAFSLRNSAWSGTLLGLGAAAKLFPAFIGPPLFLANVIERRYRSAVLLTVAATVTLGLFALEVYLVAGAAGFSYLDYQEARGIEIESVAGGLALLGDKVGLARAQLFIDFRSWQVESSLIDGLTLPLTALTLAILATLVGGAFWRFRSDVGETGSASPASVVAAVVATLLAVILTNKVLSPQYMVWLLPFAALLPRRQSLLMVVILALTTLIYPFQFQQLIALRAEHVLALNLRNALLVVLFFWVAVPEEAWQGLRARLARSV